MLFDVFSSHFSIIWIRYIIHTSDNILLSVIVLWLGSARFGPHNIWGECTKISALKTEAMRRVMKIMLRRMNSVGYLMASPPGGIISDVEMKKNISFLHHFEHRSFIHFILFFYFILSLFVLMVIVSSQHVNRFQSLREMDCIFFAVFNQFCMYVYMYILYVINKNEMLRERIIWDTSLSYAKFQWIANEKRHFQLHIKLLFVNQYPHLTLRNDQCIWKLFLFELYSILIPGKKIGSKKRIRCMCTDLFANFSGVW